MADMELLGENRFDAAVLNMVLMDMPDIAAVAGGLRHVLKARAPQSTPHPSYPSARRPPTQAC